MNPIESVWGHLRQFLKDEKKPKTRQELFDAIREYWQSKVTIDYCRKSIDHVKKQVIPDLIHERGCLPE